LSSFRKSRAESRTATDAAVSLLLLALLWLPAKAVAPIRPTLNVTSVGLEVTWVEDSAELDAIRRRYRPFSDGDALAAFGRRVAGLEKGFSVLVRKDDQFICRIYVFKPIVVDDDATTAVGHELLHCLLGSYHR
jgi:hypothetical protein